MKTKKNSSTTPAASSLHVKRVLNNTDIAGEGEGSVIFVCRKYDAGYVRIIS